MRKIYIIILLSSVISFTDVLSQNNYADKHKKKVINQHRLDIQNRDTILRELNAFLDRSSGMISNGHIKLGAPVEGSAITEIREMDNFHYTGVIPPKIYGYINTGSLNMRAEDNQNSEIVGKIKFRERIEIIFQSDKIELIRKINAPWLLVKRENGDEGWVFGAFISERIPSEIDSDTGKTDWNMIIPASGRISSRFGKRIDPVSKRRNSFHQGIDISAPEGTPVYAAENGIVADAGYKKSGYGNLIIIKHADGLATYYGHLSKITVSKGGKVSKGDLIGRVGSTGKSTGPHLHFEIRKGDKALDPEEFVR